MRFRLLLVVPVLLLVGLVLGMNLNDANSNTDTREQLIKLHQAFLQVVNKYVEQVEPNDLAESAILGMLDGLDPHSSYISAEEIAEVREGYRGSFGGIGIWFEIVNDTARVTSTIADGPSEAAGLMAGDRLVAADDSSLIGRNNRGIQDFLKGPIGSPVTVTVLRRGESEPLDFPITRGRIPLFTIDSAYMLDGQTGYIKVGRFAATTYREFKDNLDALRAEGMQRLVLDLRNNPGGVMESAVRMVDEMLKDNNLIVYTEGRLDQFNTRESARMGGTFEQQPVIVLVNENSASASEIVAGALQDHDRALIVGRHTFGKALVQQQFPLSDGSVLQMTIARYYTPSGRLIQTPYETGDIQSYYEDKLALDQTTIDLRAYLEDIPDSLKYTTAHGRTVYGGGGILPDYIIKPDSTPPIIRAVVGKGLDAFFVRDWFETNETTLRDTWNDRQEDFINTFAVDDALWNAFWEDAKTRGFDLVGGPAVEEGTFTYADAEAERRTLTTLLKARIAQKLFGARAWYPVVRTIDHELQEALDLWAPAQELAAMQ